MLKMYEFKNIAEGSYVRVYVCMPIDKRYRFGNK